MFKRFDKKHSSTISIFNVGDNVSVKIPEEGRNSTDPLHLPCIISNVSGGRVKIYQLLSRHGIIDSKYRAG